VLPILTSQANQQLRLQHLWPTGTACPYDEVIDVRSPAEYAEDHLPGAINLPVLNDAERVEVGRLYRQAGSFTAAKIGAAYVSANIGIHLRQHFANKEKDYKPLCYCWRGGQRSASLAHVLASIGWRVTVLEGGYRTYRKHVLKELTILPDQFEFRVISGMTGCGKTLLLKELATLGAQVIDFEEMADHRGSVLGGRSTQPTQKSLDSMILGLLARFDSRLPVWVEAEGNRLGNLYLPSAVVAKMQAAEVLEIQMPKTARIAYLTAEYADLQAKPMELKGLLRRLGHRHGGVQIEQWCTWVDQNRWSEITESLLLLHYDPAYAKSMTRDFPNLRATHVLSDCSVETLRSLARQLLG
jgi:tRNA 2-selenouridine synthase